MIVTKEVYKKGNKHKWIGLTLPLNKVTYGGRLTPSPRLIPLIASVSCISPPSSTLSLNRPLVTQHLVACHAPLLCLWTHRQPLVTFPRDERERVSIRNETRYARNTSKKWDLSLVMTSLSHGKIPFLFHNGARSLKMTKRKIMH